VFAPLAVGWVEEQPNAGGGGEIMNANLNLVIAWTWILLGFAGGMVLGLFFHQESWLGGYASLKRRLYRLAHISCFGLGAVNLLFAVTARNWLGGGGLTGVASLAFAIGALTMPVCCVVTAHFPKARALFVVPVLNLLAGGTLVLIQLLKP
jgi:hypothetical protein